MALRALIARLFGRRSPARAAPDHGDVDALIIDLSLRVPDHARAEFEADAQSLRNGPPRDRPVALATLFCRAEDHLAATATDDPEAFRAAFREQVARQWPRLAASEPMTVILLPPQRQEEALCRVFLRAALQSAEAIFGATPKIVELRDWVQHGLEAGRLSPFAAGTEETAATPIVALQNACHSFYAWLDGIGGRSAVAIYEDAYRTIARQFGAADGFPVVLAMLPQRLLTADKISLLRRSQIEHVLRDKNAALERANADIRQAHDLLEDRVRERTRALEQAKAEADAANRAKSEFLAHVSHELRTPLNAILGFSHILMDDTVEDIARARRREYAGHIHDSGTHLLAVINQILDLAKLEAGRFEMSEDIVMIPDLVEGCLTKSGLRVNGVEYSVEESVSPGLPPLVGDQRMLTQMLLNLIGNAMKFTPAGGTIRIDACLNEIGGCDLAVHDTGIGMDEHEIPQALQPFRQLRNVYVRDKGGTGLGLPLVAQMAKLHDGELILRSKRGRGTSAVIRLPPQRLYAVRAAC